MGIRSVKGQPQISPPPDDGREWITADDAATMFGILRKTLLYHAVKLEWTCYRQPCMQTWILKKDVVSWHNFLKDRERWYKRRRPKTWQPEIAMNHREDEELFKRIYWSAAQAAAFMGVSRQTINNWSRQGKIPVFLTRKMGEGGKNWYSQTNLRNLKESEEWQRGHAIWAKAKATIQQGTCTREVYTARHQPRIYRNIPPGWITLREVAERLDISISAARRLRKMKRFMSEQFVGEWDNKWRPWFCDEDGVEAYKNNEEYQQARQRGLNAMQAMLRKPVDTAGDTPHLPPLRPTVPPELTFGYTREELRLPRERVIGVDEMW